MPIFQFLKFFHALLEPMAWHVEMLCRNGTNGLPSGEKLGILLLYDRA